jgi:hypothetical protein
MNLTLRATSRVLDCARLAAVTATAFVAALAIAEPAVAAPTYHLVDLGAGVIVSDINSHGVIVGHDADGAAILRDDVWHHRKADSAGRIDGQGEVTGALGRTALYWPDDSTPAIDVTVPQLHAILATGVERGTVVGYGTAVSGANHCYYWTAENGGFDFTPTGQWCTVVGINANAQIAGSTTPPAGGAERAFIWAGGTYQFLPVLPGGESFASEALGINRKGHVALRSVRSLHDMHLATRAALWNGHRLVDLGTIDKADYCVPIALNDGDEVIGVYSVNNTANQSFLYTGGEMLSLAPLVDNLDGWDLGFMSAIANDGTIVGNGTFQGVAHAYRLERVAQ